MEKVIKREFEKIKTARVDLLSRPDRRKKTQRLGSLLMIYDIKVAFLISAQSVRRIASKATRILDRGARDFDVLLFTVNMNLHFCFRWRSLMRGRFMLCFYPRESFTQ